LRTELHPHGVEIVTVALDVDPDAARPFIEAAGPEHPSLIDSAHLLDERFGMVNVPNAVWIDEDGMIVRAAEPAAPCATPENESFRNIDLSTVPPDIAEILTEARKIRSEPERYVEMLRDWVEHGAASASAHTPDTVIARSQPRSLDEATAAAEFDLGQHLHRAGDHPGAIVHWRVAHRLYPGNWTYKRQAWNFEDPIRQGPTDAYEGSWFEDVKQIGAENYYPPLVP
jgi:hypothetical protein